MRLDPCDPIFESEVSTGQIRWHRAFLRLSLGYADAFFPLLSRGRRALSRFGSGNSASGGPLLCVSSWHAVVSRCPCYGGVGSLPEVTFATNDADAHGAAVLVAL